MKYPNMTWGKMEAVINKLGGIKGVESFLAGVVAKTQCHLKTWRNIRLGTGLKTFNDFRKAFKKEGCGITKWTKEILGNFLFVGSIEEKEIELVAISPAELGYKDGALLGDIYSRAEERGLGLCTVEIALELRRQYKNQPKGEMLYVAVEPIKVFPSNFDCRVIFCLRYFNLGWWGWLTGDNKKPYLVAAYGHPKDFFYKDHRIVFLPNR